MICAIIGTNTKFVLIEVMDLSIVLISNILTCIFAFIGFIYGIVKFFKPRKALYAQMITLSVGCMAFGRLYQVVRLLTDGDIYNEFQLGIFGIIGSLLFFFSANFGLMDSLADDRSKQYRKYRIIPLLAPLIAAALFIVFILFYDMPRFAKIMSAILTIFVMATTYYNLKHVVFPDVDFGVIKCLKSYNLLVLLYAMFCMAEMIAISRSNEIFTAAFGVLMGITILLIVPVAERGIKKWTT